MIRDNTEGTTNNIQPFESGEVIIFCEDEYMVVDNFGDSGKVRYPNDRDIFSFKWRFEGEDCKRKMVNDRSE